MLASPGTRSVADDWNATSVASVEIAASNDEPFPGVSGASRRLTIAVSSGPSSRT